MDFEFDPRTSVSNKSKHGIDFEEAQLLWFDDDAIELDAATEPEPRSVVIGRIGRKHWTAVTTARNGKVRLISVRRSRQKEIELYEENKNIRL